MAIKKKSKAKSRKGAPKGKRGAAPQRDPAPRPAFQGVVFVPIEFHLKDLVDPRDFMKGKDNSNG